MYKRRIAFTILALLIFTALSAAVYFSVFKPESEITKASNKNNEYTNNQSITAMNMPKSKLVTSKTKVIIIYTYLVEGNTIEKEVNGSNYISSIIGLNEEEVRKFYNAMNYRLYKFTPDEIVVRANIINSWPPGSFVVKSNIDEIFIYTVDSQGVLTLPLKTGLFLDMLPPEDREEVVKGKIYDKYEDVEKLLDDYKS